MPPHISATPVVFQQLSFLCHCTVALFRPVGMFNRTSSKIEHLIVFIIVAFAIWQHVCAA